MNDENINNEENVVEKTMEIETENEQKDSDGISLEDVEKEIVRIFDEKLADMLDERIVAIINERYFAKMPKKLTKKTEDPFLMGLQK